MSSRVYKWHGKLWVYFTWEFPFKIVDKMVIEKVPVVLVTSGREEGRERERERERETDERDMELLFSIYFHFLLLLPGVPWPNCTEGWRNDLRCCVGNET